MTLNHLMNRIREADIKTVLKMAIILITTLWVVRELVFWTELREVGHFAGSISSEIKKEQKKIEKAFGEDYDKDVNKFKSEADSMEAGMHKNIDNLMEKREAFLKDFSKGAGEVERRMDHGFSEDEYKSVEFGAKYYISRIKEELASNPGNTKLKKKLEYIMPIYRRMVLEMMRLGINTECQDSHVLPECTGYSNKHWQAAWDVPQRKKNWETFWSVYRDRRSSIRVPEGEFGKPLNYTQQEREIWEKPVCMDLPGGCDENNNPAWPADQIIEAKIRIAAEKAKAESEQAAAEEAASGQ